MDTKINYIIATYGGRYPNRFNDRAMDMFRNQYLQLHLKVLNSLPNHIEQITIIRPKVDAYHAVIPDYYNFEPLKHLAKKIKIIDTDNIGASYHQCILALHLFQDEFDYHIFTEDDYIPARPEFDLILTSCLNKHDLTYFCARKRQASTYLAEQDYDHDCPIADVSMGIFNKATVKHLFSQTTYEEARSYFLSKRHCSLYINQVVFSYLLFKSGIILNSWCNSYLVLFWNNRCKSYLTLHSDVDMCTTTDALCKCAARKSPLFLPIETLYLTNILSLISGCLSDISLPQTYFTLCSLVGEK